MSAGGAVRRRADRVRATGEAGVTLLEIVVAMSVMSIVMTVFTTGILMMYRSANQTEAMSVAQSQITTAFERLDKEFRYAAAVSQPNSTGPQYFVEYLTTTTGTATCSELMVDATNASNVTLKLRRWTQPTGTPPPAPTPPHWNSVPVLASNLRVPTSQPFLPAAPDAIASSFQRLEVRLAYGAGSGSTAPTAQTDVTFTALNSDATMATAYQAICTEGRSLS